MSHDDYRFTHPAPEHGLAIWRLVGATGVLDVNSVYCYCMTLRSFGATSVMATRGSALAGFVTAYRLPERPTTLFVWQVAVDADHRGAGLATRMLAWLVRELDDIEHIETTVTPSNTASRALFTRLAERFETEVDISPGFPAAQLGGGHEPEDLFTIGPFRRQHS